MRPRSTRQPPGRRQANSIRGMNLLHFAPCLDSRSRQLKLSTSGRPANPLQSEFRGRKIQRMDQRPLQLSLLRSALAPLHPFPFLGIARLHLHLDPILRPRLARIRDSLIKLIYREVHHLDMCCLQVDLPIFQGRRPHSNHHFLGDTGLFYGDTGLFYG